ncbi:MAG: U32 family peptidase, partial [Lachnospiraceae bacterium]|nr:U32 family peptidase [Lachnospiraceae bacterium]
MKKIELLSPAGDYNSFLAAISCGADAVYLSGDKFGARAYAKNFSKEELIKAIDYAHIFSRKVYLTLNTLLKDEEMGEIYDYLLPLYEAGLDAVIVQDMGVISYIRKVFYDMPVHASTQLTITGIEGIRLLENLGVTRTVLARELSMKEIEYIHDNSNMELETFIHGALCYSYSGKCLFSSLAGGRSGNRGRCAGPCRQPYNDEYLLSTKDICSIDYIPSMIKAGICSLKIEGRMKSPEYVGKVTAIYRKYIDYYYDNITKMSVKEISDKFFTGHEFNNDKNILIKLYTRGGNSSGYYYKHNGREMISVSDASYKTEKEENKDIDFTNNIKMPLSAFVRIYPDENISILINNEFYYEGNKALVAKNRPTDSETVLKQLKKTKDTEFEFTDINFDIAKNAFVLLSDLNELRREAINCVRNELTKKYKRKSDFNRNTIVSEMSDESIKDQAFSNNSDLDKDRSISDSKIVINCEITNYEQLKAAASSEYVNGIYIPFIL